ncbi:MAG: hypothetical protein WAO04_11430, partial [Candidatus Sulfotelmatobacter sp.]
EAIAIRQTEIENKRVVRHAFGSRQPVSRRLEEIDAEAKTSQSLNNRLGQSLVVLYEQDAHALPQNRLIRKFNHDEIAASWTLAPRPSVMR